MDDSLNIITLLTLFLNDLISLNRRQKISAPTTPPQPLTASEGANATNKTFNLMLALYTCDNFFAPKCAMKPVPKFQSRSIFHGSGCVVPDLTTLKMIN